jgi:hypothetical protein
LVDVCAAAGFRQMIGYIDADNAPVARAARKFGFARAGLLRGVAYRTAAGPTPSWCSARSAPVAPRRRPSPHPDAKILRGKVSRLDLDTVGMQRPVMQRLVLAESCFRPFLGLVLVGGVDLERTLAHLDLAGRTGRARPS